MQQFRAAQRQVGISEGAGDERGAEPSSEVRHGPAI